MKVLCINESWQTSEVDAHAPRPNFGDFDIVINSEIEEATNDAYYQLERFGRSWYYKASHFVEISDLDETTLVNEEWEEKVCEPVNSEPCV